MAKLITYSFRQTLQEYICNFLRSSTHFVARNMVSIKRRDNRSKLLWRSLSRLRKHARGLGLHFETSVKRAFKKVLLSYCLSIGSNFRFFTLQEKLTKIRYSYVTPLLGYDPKIILSKH